MKRWWISWWHGAYEDEGFKEPNFDYWQSGQRDRPNDGMSPEDYAIYEKADFASEADMYAFIDAHGRDDASFVAVIDALTEEDAWKIVEEFFPGCEHRFCDERAADYDPRKTPNGRFK